MGMTHKAGRFGAIVAFAVFGRLAKHDPAAGELLRLCSFLNPREIPVDLLLSRPDLLAGNLTGHLAAGTSSGDGDRAVDVLVEASLASRLDGQRIRLNRMVPSATRRRLKAGARRAWAHHTASALAKLMPADPWQPSAWPVCAQLAPHISAAAKHAPGHPDTALTLARLGQYLYAGGEYTTAKTVLVQALAIKERVYGGQHPALAITLGTLGNVHKQLGDLAAAERALTRALAIKEKVNGVNSPQSAVTLGNLGNVMRAQGDLAGAKAMQLRALSIEEASHGPDHPQVASTLGNLGAVQRQLGELGEAKASLRRALAIFEAAHGPDHPDVATALHNLANLHHELGETALAENHQRRALAIRQSVLGTDHPQTVKAREYLNRLG